MAYYFPMDFQARHHPFEGCFNFRDIGGYPAGKGQQVRWGLCYRAGRQDQMTAQDRQGLAALGIKAQVDLRRPAEIAVQGQGPLPEMGAAYHHLPILPDGSAERLSQVVGMTGISGQRYLGYLEFAGPPLAKLFELLAGAENLPLVIHCVAGKDRTGIAIALLLATLGVDRPLIEADYRLTNLDVGRHLGAIEASGALPKGMSRDAMALVAGVPEDAISVFLDGLDERYGGPIAYLRSIGVPEETLNAIRAAFLEASP